MLKKHIKYCPHLNIFGDIASIIGLSTIMYFNIVKQEDISVPGILFLILIGIILLYLIIINALILRYTRDVEFAETFSDYCTKCAEMLEKSSDSIYTVQTPYKKVGDYENEFKTYLNRTVNRLLYRKKNNDLAINNYQRLIIVDNYTIDDEIRKFKSFINELFLTGNSRPTKPSYNNINICIVNRFCAAQLFYSNLDVHITSDYNYALAFQAPGENGEYTWSSSVHLLPNSRVKEIFTNITTLKNAFNMLWNEGKRTGGEFNFMDKYNQNETNYLNEQVRLINIIIVKMRLIAQEYKL